MKTTLASTSVALITLAVSTTSSFAQADYDNAGTPESSAAAVPVVYQAPVIYHAPVIYQAPVVYYAPVYYMMAAPAPAECAPPRRAPSTVFVIGAHGGSYGYANYGDCSPTVIRFGQEGGWFGR